MLIGLLLLVFLLPFRVFFALWNMILGILGLEFVIPSPTIFRDVMLQIFQSMYLFDWVFPTSSFIMLFILSVRYFILFRAWQMLVFVYKRIRGS